MKRKLERKSSVKCFLESLNKEPTFKGEKSNSFASNDSKKFDIKAPIHGSTGHLLSLERCTKGYSLFQGLRYRQGHNFTKLTKSDKKIKLPMKYKMKSSIAKYTGQRNFATYPIVLDRNEEDITGNTSKRLFSILSEEVQEKKSRKKIIVKNIHFQDICTNLSNAYPVLSVDSKKSGQIDQEIVHNDNQNQQNGFLHRNKKQRRKSSSIQKQKSPKHLFEPIGNSLDIILSPPVEFRNRKLELSISSNTFSPTALIIADYQAANIPGMNANKQLENGESVRNNEQFKVFNNSYSLALTRACFNQNTVNSAPVTFPVQKLEPSVSNNVFTPPVQMVADCQVVNIPETNSSKQFEDGESINKKGKFKVVGNTCSLPLTPASIRPNAAINENDYKIPKKSVGLELENEECSRSLMFNCKNIFSCNEFPTQKGNVILDLGSKSDLEILEIQNPIQQQEVKNYYNYVASKGIDSLDPDTKKASDSMDVQKISHTFEDMKRWSDLVVNDCNDESVTITGVDFIHSGAGKESTNILVLPELSSSNAFPLMYKGFYINPMSGHTLAVGTGVNSLPILFKSNENNSTILPKGKSPFLKKMQDDPVSPLAMSDQMKLGNLVHEFAFTLCNNDKDHSFFNAPIQSCNDADSALAEEIKFQKDSLKNSRVIAQLDSKFVCAFDDESGVIFVVDQHAAHERIKLEELFKEHIQPNGTVMHSLLNQPLILPLCEEKKKNVGTKVDLLEKCGVTFKNITTGLEISSVPLCFLLRKKYQTRGQLQQLVSDTIDEILDTPLKSKFIPSTVVSALASIACHGSVRFGRKMSRDSCLQLIRLLSAQKLPFQCAHGRPSLVPLIKIPTFANVQLSKPVKNLVAMKKKFNA